MALVDEAPGLAHQALPVAELERELLVRGDFHDFGAFFGQLDVPGPEGYRADQPHVLDFVEGNLENFAILHGPEFDHFLFGEETQDVAEQLAPVEECDKAIGRRTCRLWVGIVIMRRGGPHK